MNPSNTNSHFYPWDNDEEDDDHDFTEQPTRPTGREVKQLPTRDAAADSVQEKRQAQREQQYARPSRSSRRNASASGISTHPVTNEVGDTCQSRRNLHSSKYYLSNGEHTFSWSLRKEDDSTSTTTTCCSTGSTTAAGGSKETPRSSNIAGHQEVVVLLDEDRDEQDNDVVVLGVARPLPPEASRRSRRTRKIETSSSMPFPRVLRNLLDNPGDFGDVISWTSNGEIVAICRSDIALGVLGNIFGKNTIKIFLDELQRWGFQREKPIERMLFKRTGHAKMLYQQPLFRRDKPDLVNQMVRSPVSQEGDSVLLRKEEEVTKRDKSSRSEMSRESSSPPPPSWERHDHSLVLNPGFVADDAGNKGARVDELPRQSKSCCSSRKKRARRVEQTLAVKERKQQRQHAPRVSDSAEMLEPSSQGMRQNGGVFRRPESTATKRDQDKSNVSKMLPQKLRLLLDHPGVFGDKVVWSDNGEWISIYPSGITADVLSKYLEGRTYAGFERRLRKWGFQRGFLETQAGGQEERNDLRMYHHPLFQRSNPTLMDRMEIGSHQNVAGSDVNDTLVNQVGHLGALDETTHFQQQHGPLPPGTFFQGRPMMVPPPSSQYGRGLPFVLGANAAPHPWYHHYAPPCPTNPAMVTNFPRTRVQSLVEIQQEREASIHEAELRLYLLETKRQQSHTDRLLCQLSQPRLQACGSLILPNNSTNWVYPETRGSSGVPPLALPPEPDHGAALSTGTTCTGTTRPKKRARRKKKASTLPTNDKTETKTFQQGDTENCQSCDSTYDITEVRWKWYLQELDRFLTENGRHGPYDPERTDFGHEQLNEWVQSQYHDYCQLMQGKPSALTQQQAQTLKEQTGFPWRRHKSRKL